MDTDSRHADQDEQPQRGPSLLEVDNVSKSFGGVYALQDVTLRVTEGAMHGVIGANGAGKSTLFNIISGHLVQSSGSVVYMGSAIDGLAPHRRASKGMSIVFQGARIFHGMTVLENVMVGAHSWSGAGFLAAALRTKAQRSEERAIREVATSALDRVGLGAWADRPAESLPLGHQRRMQLARSLCAKPTLLLLDEPATGLRAGELEEFTLLLEDLKGEGLTMMLVEHNIAFVTRLVDEMTVLDLGKVIAAGRPDVVVRNPAVVSAYLGEGVDDA